MSQCLLITGGTGYLGSKLTARLVESGAEVAVLTRRPATDQTANVPWFTHDGSIGSVAEAVRRANPGQVIHLAASYVRHHLPSEVAGLVEANITFGALVLQAMQEAGCHRFLYAGSVFQQSASAQGGPRNLYAATKNAFEEILDYYEASAEIETVRLTLCDVYGEDDPRPRFLNAAVEAAVHGSVLQVPLHDPYLLPIHVDDAVRAFQTGLTTGGAKTGFWVGPNKGLRISEIIPLVSRLARSTVEVERTDLPALAGDTLTPAPEATLPDWFPHVTLEDGIQRMIDALRATGDTSK